MNKNDNAETATIATNDWDVVEAVEVNGAHHSSSYKNNRMQRNLKENQVLTDLLNHEYNNPMEPLKSENLKNSSSSCLFKFNDLKRSFGNRNTAESKLNESDQQDHITDTDDPSSLKNPASQKNNERNTSNTSSLLSYNQYIVNGKTGLILQKNVIFNDVHQKASSAIHQTVANSSRKKILNLIISKFYSKFGRKGFFQRPTCFAFHPTKNIVCIGDANGRITIFFYNSETDKPSKYSISKSTILHWHASTVFDIEFTSVTNDDQSFLVSGGM